jgi:hypothetical protein
MNQTSTGSNRVEVKMVFTSDASKATSELSKIAASAKNVDMVAKEAQKNLERMNGPNGASKINSPAFPSTVRDAQGNTHSVQAWQSAQKRIEASRQKEEETKALKAMQGGNRVTEPSQVGGGGGGLELVAKGAIALSAINSISAGINTLGDTSKGARGKLLGLVETLPIVGSTVAGLTKALIAFGESGLRKDLSLQEKGNALADAKGQNRFGIDQKIRAGRIEQTGTIEQSRSGTPSYFVSGVGGEDERITAAKMNEDRAMKAANRALVDSQNFDRTDLKRANKSVDVNQNFVNASLAREKELANQAAAAQNNKGFVERNQPIFDFAKSPIIPLVKAAAGSYNDKSPLNGLPQQEVTQGQRKDLGRALVEQEEALRTSKEKSLNAALKLNEYEKARTETMKAQAQLLKDQYAAAKGQEEDFGSMDAEKKQTILDTLKKSKEQGFAALDSEEKSLISGNSATSKYAREESAKLGASDDRLAQIRELTGERSSKAIGEDLQKVSATINAKIEIDESVLAEKLANILGQLVKSIEMNLSKQLTNSNSQLDAELVKQRKLSEAS